MHSVANISKHLRNSMKSSDSEYGELSMLILRIEDFYLMVAGLFLQSYLGI